MDSKTPRASAPRFVSSAVVGLTAFALLPATAHAAGTLAGTTIDNVATATFDGPGGPETIQSNTVTITVAELLDVVVNSADPGNVAADAGAAGRALAYTVTNSGNGQEAFALVGNGTVAGDDFDPTVQSIYIDANGNNQYDAATDTLYVPGSNDPVLNPDQSVTVFILSSIPAGATDNQTGDVALTASAVTGTGPAGTTFAGAGTGGTDAVVGTSTARQSDAGTFIVRAASVALSKAQSIVDGFGGSQPLPGATVTYTITATVTGSGSLANLGIADSVPAGTSYVPGSLSLQGAALTDAADADAGRFDGTGISVALGTVAGGQTRSVTFRVTID